MSPLGWGCRCRWPLSRRLQMLSLQHHQVTITISPDGAGSKVTWDVSVEPAEMLDIFVGTYTGALAALKTSLES